MSPRELQGSRVGGLSRLDGDRPAQGKVAIGGDTQLVISPCEFFQDEEPGRLVERNLPGAARGLLCFTGRDELGSEFFHGFSSYFIHDLAFHPAVLHQGEIQVSRRGDAVFGGSLVT
jgi:hypothetical protein